MTTHINKICRPVLYHLDNIRRIRKFLTYDNKKLLVQAVILSRIDYCNSLLFGVASIHLTKLQRIKNTAARLVCYNPKHEYITPTLIRLHWLPVKFRINFKIAMLVYKCIYNKAPKYLSSLIEFRKVSRYSLRSNEGILLLDNSAKAKKTFSSICEILLCIVVFFLTHIVALDTFIVLLSYLMLVLYISVPVAHFVRGRGQNIYRLEICSMHFVFSKNS